MTWLNLFFLLFAHMFFVHFDCVRNFHSNRIICFVLILLTILSKFFDDLASNDFRTFLMLRTLMMTKILKNEIWSIFLKKLSCFLMCANESINLLIFVIDFALIFNFARIICATTTIVMKLKIKHIFWCLSLLLQFFSFRNFFWMRWFFRFFRT